MLFAPCDAKIQMQTYYTTNIRLVQESCEEKRKLLIAKGENKVHL